MSRKQRILILIAVLLCVFLIWWRFFKPIDAENIDVPYWITQEYLSVDGHARTGYETNRINGIVIHYVANPGSTAQENRDYFETSGAQVSSHFIVGLEGEIIQCIPLNEQSSASNRRNVDTISIEVCHPDSTGEFSIPSYNAAVKLCVWLCQEFDLDEEDIIRHYDCAGANNKNCPKYYVEHPDSWAKFKEYIKERL